MFKERLKQCREDKLLIQAEMAKILNISRQAYNHYETGIRLPTQETLVVLANFFGVSVDYLLCRTDEPNENKDNPLDKDLEDADLAVLGEVKDLTGEQKKDILEYIRFKKSQNK